MMASMIDVKTDELSGDLLDCLVATIENPAEKIFWFKGEGYTLRWHYKPDPYSTDWARGGPLLDKYRIGFGLYDVKDRQYLAITGLNDVGGSAYGPTHLIAACRAIVAANLGDTVQVAAPKPEGGV